jgi:hypothetical protein
VTPSETLEKIRRKFGGLGISHQDLTVDVSGVSYRISLDSESFVVYRVNHCRGHKHHVPGWPVCLVTRDAIFQECSDEGLGADHCSCGVTIEQWIEIMQENCAEL